MRLIDADELLRVAEDIEKYAETIPNNELQISGMAHITQLIHEAPTIDAVLVETLNQIPEACKNCSNHPSNGGSGICFCTLGTMRITL